MHILGWPFLCLVYWRLFQNVLARKRHNVSMIGYKSYFKIVTGASNSCFVTSETGTALPFRSTWVFSEVRAARSFVICVVLCIIVCPFVLFILATVFSVLWLILLITPLVSSIFSCICKIYLNIVTCCSFSNRSMLRKRMFTTDDFRIK
jgi:hypothetical protein